MLGHCVWIYSHTPEKKFTKKILCAKFKTSFKTTSKMSIASVGDPLVELKELDSLLVTTGAGKP